MRCRTCDGVIEAIDVSLDGRVATCPSCGSLQDREVLEVAPAAQTRKRPPVPLPARFSVEALGGVTRVRWTWRSWARARDLLGLLAGSAAVALVPPLRQPCFGWWFGALLAASLYAALARLVNATAVEVTRESIAVRHRPLPWTGNASWPAEEVEQVFSAVQPGVRRSVVGYQVKLKLKSRSGAVALVRDLETPEQALFLEQELEAALRLEDRAVEGELPR